MISDSEFVLVKDASMDGSTSFDGFAYSAFVGGCPCPDKSVQFKREISGKIEADLSGRFCMKKSKFTGEEITFALRQSEVGTPVTDVCSKIGVSRGTYYRLKQHY